MINFDELEQIKEMDFSQMRKKPCAGGMCATDEAIFEFLSHLNNFFVQFTEYAPSEAHLRHYAKLMTEIADKASQAEIDYYTKKYTPSEGPENAARLAAANFLNYEKLPTRMQYWSAGEEWGDRLRNNDLHKKVIQSINRWHGMLKRLDCRHNVSFFRAAETSDETTTHCPSNSFNQ